MNKFMTFVGVGLMGAALVLPATAAQAQSCANQAVWTYDGDALKVEKWSTSGTLLSSVDVTIESPDLAIDSTLSQLLSADLSDDSTEVTVTVTDAATGATVGSHVVTGLPSLGLDETYVGLWGAGVIASGELLLDLSIDGYSTGTIYAVDRSTWAATLWGDLADADASLPVEFRGGTWDVAGDILQLPDNDILVLATNDLVEGSALLVRVNGTNHSDMKVVGVIDSDDSIWGAARAGDDVFLATAGGKLLKVASIPTTAGTGAVATTEVNDTASSFWGAAGSDDSTAGNAEACSLASTGTSSAGFAGLAALALIAGAGAIALGRRKGAVA